MNHHLRLLFFACLLILLNACSHSSQDYFETGNKFFADGKYADAQLNYSKAIQKNPRFGQAYYKLGLAATRQKHAAEAYAALRKAVEQLPGEIAPRIALADICFAFYFQNDQLKSMYDETRRLAAEILKMDANSPDGLRLSGALALMDRKPAEATEFYRRASEIGPANGEVVLGYTQALAQSGKFSDAEKVALDFLVKNPKFTPVYDTLYDQYLATNRAADAQKILERWGENNPKDATPVLRLATQHARASRMDQMAGVLQRLLDNRGNFPLARLQVGDFYAGLGKWTEAVSQYEQGEKEDPNNATVYEMKLVSGLLAQGKKQDAAERLDKVLKRSPNDTEALTTRARLWLDSGTPEDLDKALAGFQAVRKVHPKDPIVMYDLGRLYIRKGDVDSARARFRESAGAAKDFFPPRMELAQLALNQQNPSEAIRFAEEILTSTPGNPQGRLIRAAGLMLAARLPEARDELRSLLRDYPQYREAQLQAGLLAIHEKRFKEAEDLFRKLGGSGVQDIRPAMGLATAFSSQKQYDRAIQILSDESKKAPGAPAIQNLLALTALQAARYPVAIENFKRVAEAYPTSVEAQVNLAEAHRLNGDANSAIAVLEKAKALEFKNPQALGTIAAAFYNVGRLDESKDLMRRMVQMQRTPSALNNLAYLIAETGGDLNEAQKFAEQAVQKGASDTHNQDTLGWVYLKKNMIDPAVQIFSNLVKNEPENATFRYHLGAALLKKGDKARAQDELQAALKKGPSSAEQSSIKNLLSDIK